MANQMSKSFCFFALMALFFAVQFIQIDGDECTKIVGNCEVADCTDQCNSFAEGRANVLKASCSFLNLCTCTFDRPPPITIPTPTCDIGLGVCGNACNYDCCQEKCQSRYSKTSLGRCRKIFNRDICLCTYAP
ncbi:unnamed protein product [Vicia faba]|uniref:Defensin-like protein n=1 Tax=Vicia faba TaxID=3906 RepID=A0AAV0YVJ1_VICFA|nr:unnamed protein product [Vicia faba]